jgi:hypothetical protein
VEPAAAYLASAVGAVLLATHWMTRPHLFTFVLLALLIELLDRPKAPPPWTVVGLFVPWANLHGGWIFGVALLFAWAVGRRTWWTVPLALVATLATPYGPDGPRHLLAHLGDTALLKEAHEFQPPTFTDAGSVVFLLAVIGAVAGFVRLRPRVPLEHAFAMLGFAVGGFLARRNIPLVALTALPLAMLHLDPLLRRLPEPPNFRRSFAGAADGSWVPGAFGAAIVWAAAFATHLGGPRLLPAAFDARVFPVEAVASLRDSGQRPRLFNEYTWGGYVLWADPGQRVFIDPGADFYGAGLARDYLTVWEVRPGWREVLQRFDVDAALVPAGVPLARALAREAGWSVAHGDATAVLLVRAMPAPAATP